MIGNSVGAIVIREASSSDIKTAKIFRMVYEFLGSGIKFFESGIREREIPDPAGIPGREIPSRLTPRLRPLGHLNTPLNLTAACRFLNSAHVEI